jgi:hypothetical protein
MPSAGFEPATPATKRPQTYVLHRAATEVVIFGLRTSNVLEATGVTLTRVSRDKRECFKWLDLLLVSFLYSSTWLGAGLAQAV